MSKIKSGTVSVSEISSYADDPVRFCKFKGGAFNQKAADRGTKAHNAAGKSVMPMIFFVVVVMIFFVVVVMILTGYAWISGLIGL